MAEPKVGRLQETNLTVVREEDFSSLSRKLLPQQSAGRLCIVPHVLFLSGGGASLSAHSTGKQEET